MVAASTGYSYEEFAIKKGKKRLVADMWNVGRVFCFVFEIVEQTF